MTVMAHRSAEEIGRTAPGPRPLPPLGRDPRRAAARRRGRTLPNGLRVLAAHRPGVPMVELRLRVPFADPATRRDPTTRPSPSCSRPRCSTGTATRDRVAIDDELAAVGADLGVSVDPERLQIGGSGLADGLPDAARRARRRAHRAPPTPTPRWPASASGSSSGSPWPAPSRARSPGRRCSASASATTRSPGRCPRAEDVAAVTAEQVRALHAAALVPARRRSSRSSATSTRPTAIAQVEQAARRLDGRRAGPRAGPAAAITPSRPAAGAPGRLGAVAAAAVRARAAPRRPALRGAAAGQPRVRRLLLLALDGERPRGQGLHLRRALRASSSSPAARCSAWRPTWPATSPPPRCWRPATSWAGSTAVPPTAAEIDAARAYAVGSLLISLDNQGGLASTLVRAGRRRTRRSTGCATTRRGWRPSRSTQVADGGAGVLRPDARSPGWWSATRT